MSEKKTGMSSRFTTLVRIYAGQLLLLTRRLFRCSPLVFMAEIPIFVVNQVAFVLALMLPLKVIIMLGSDGVPRYFRFFMTEETRDAWLVGLALAAVGMFLIYLATNFVLSRLEKRGGERVLIQSRKTGLFDDQDRFASDVFGRVVATWGAVAMAIGGVALGLVLEWRLIVLVLAAIVLEFVFFAIYWNRFGTPERADELEQLAARRTNILQNLSAINVLLLFGGLVYLFLTDPAMNFIVGVLLFLLARQILARSVRIFADANFFMQNRERIDALVHPGRHLREKRSSDRDSFESLLMPERRSRFFHAIGQAAGTDLAASGWQWRDAPGKGGAFFVRPATSDEPSEFRIKIKMRKGDAGLARETMFYRSDSAGGLGLSCELVDAGSMFGRGYLLLRSSPLEPCPPQDAPEIAFQIRTRLWKHQPDKDLAQRLLRSFPPLDVRLTPERISRVRLACNKPLEEQLLDEFLGRLPQVIDALQRLPRALCNQALVGPNIFLMNSQDPVVLNWEAIRIDIIGADLLTADLDRTYFQDFIGKALDNKDCSNATLPTRALPLVVQAAQIDRLISLEAYGAALETVPRLLEVFDDIIGNVSRDSRFPGLVRTGIDISKGDPVG